MKSIEFRVKTKKGYRKARITNISKTHPRGVYSVNVSVANELFNKGMIVKAKNKVVLKKKMKSHVNKLIKKHDR
ncbi:hypothetical protein LCGC14_1336300 [marine sediment metagenome]|uniref:Uncharacterized protein n=1 Tax=marine sediment metagenome TaxID=412755 RepID=A0A0F9L187_9ZZZZ